MPTAQAAEIVKDALAAPLNNLVAISLILALVIVGSVVFVIWKLVPIIFKQVQQLIDNNSKLTTIAAQNAEHVKISAIALEKNTVEMTKQTNAIESQTVEIKSQSLDLRNYQILVSDNLANHSTQIEANTATLARFEATMNGLPEQLRVMIDDKLACAGIEQSIRALRAEVMQLISQQLQAKRTTGTIPIVPMQSPSEGNIAT